MNRATTESLPTTSPDASAVVVARLEGVVKRFGDLAAVDGVTLNIRRGTCYALLGPNGAGKTTLSRMIGAVLPRDEGRLTVLGLDPGVEESEVKARLGVVMQDHVFDEDLDVLRNLEIYGLFFWRKGPTFRKRVRDLLRFVELEGKEKMNIQELSGGMKRRLMIARALLNDPDFLILDEPTTGLDPQVRHAIWATMRKLKAQGITIVITPFVFFSGLMFPVQDLPLNLEYVAYALPMFHVIETFRLITVGTAHLSVPWAWACPMIVVVFAALLSTLGIVRMVGRLKE